MKKLEIKIFGRVQAVNLRSTVKDIAKLHNINGYIHNESDGSVSCLLQGDEEDLKLVLEAIQKFSFPIKITGLHYTWSDSIDSSLSTFSINRDNSFFSDQLKAISTLGKRLSHPNEQISVPNHVVIIPDGNRRWARHRKFKPWVGHKKAQDADSINEILQKCMSLGVKYFTVWGFSTENWDRSETEINYLWDIFRKSMGQWSHVFEQKNIRFKHIGRKDRLPEDIISQMNTLEEKTKDNTKLQFSLCLDYGGRDEIIRAINKINREDIKEVTEEILRKYLDTSEMPDPDLIIRTAGEKRTSGLLPFQSAYAELYFTDVYFPDFNVDEFMLAILDFSGRIRRFGGSNKKDLAGIDESKLIDPDSLKIKNQNLL